MDSLACRSWGTQHVLDLLRRNSVPPVHGAPLIALGSAR